ncbi:hypothetical protein [Syntrophomonas wolfei]|uniref:hypothetical protein n=1 Tax=Syntrophomonas wolfei TaxID=863 RepID=UPI000ECF6875|nr:hypothetical protein [Syntrophomonas sp.]
MYHSLNKVLSAKGMVTSAGDEGGFAPYLSSNKAALEVTIPGLMFKSKKYSKEVIRQNGGCL